MSKYLITGGEGFIGRNITAATGGVPFDIKSGLNILNPAQLEKALDGLRSAKDTLGISTGIFHCAAKISVPESVEKPEEYHRTNVDGTKNIIDAAKNVGAKIIFSSSAAVYGESSVRVSETSHLHPKSPYAENKRDGEGLLEKSGQPHVALRYFNAYGPGQSPQYAGVITFFIMNALKGADLVIYGDGKQVRDFVFVDDIVQANVMAMEYENKKFEIFNIGSGSEISINQLAEIIIELTNSSSKIVYMPARAGDIVYSQADVSKAKKVLGWEAKVSLEEGLRKTVGFYRNIN